MLRHTFLARAPLRARHLAGALIILGSLLTAWTLGLTAPGSGGPAAGTVTVTLRLDGTDRQVTTQAACVAELIASQGLALGPQDEATPDLDAPLSAGMLVVVKRVTTATLHRQVEVPPPTITRVDPRVARAVVLHPGRPGLADALVEVTYRDGAETGQRVLSQTVIRKPQPQIVVTGSGLPSRGTPMLMMEATAYDPGPRSCGRYASGRTAIGMKAGKGVVAVDPRVIPLGTRLYIEGYGAAVAGDVGSAIKGRRIDLGFGTYAEAIRWGRRNVRVQILD